MHGEQRLLMMRHLHPVARGMRGDTPPFGDPASQGDVGVEDIDRSPLDQVTAAPALHLALPSRDPHAGGSPHLTHATHLSYQCTGSSNQAMLQSATPRAKA